MLEINSNSASIPKVTANYSSNNSLSEQSLPTTGSTDNGEKQTNLLKQGELDKEKLNQNIEQMNKAMDAFNTDLQFKIHEKTGVLMVLIVNPKTDEVLKEFPPQEFLDTKAKIRDYIGMLLDKKA